MIPKRTLFEKGKFDEYFNKLYSIVQQDDFQDGGEPKNKQEVFDSDIKAEVRNPTLHI